VRGSKAGDSLSIDESDWVYLELKKRRVKLKTYFSDDLDLRIDEPP
jgi:hypothetical protein